MKITYLYRMLIGYNNNVDVDLFMYARNAKVAKEYCKELYREKKYNYYHPIKVGLSFFPRDTGLVSDEDDLKLRSSLAVQGEKYSEKEIVWPQYIPKQKAGDSDV